MATPREKHFVGTLVFGHFGYPAKSVKKIQTGCTCIVWLVTLTNGKRIAVKMPRPDQNPTIVYREQLAYQLLHDRVSVPAVLCAGRNYVIQEFVHGKLGSKAPLTLEEQNGVFAQLGSAIRRVHEIKGKGFGPVNTEERGSFDSWEDYMAEWYGTARAALSDCDFVEASELNRLDRSIAKSTISIRSQDAVLLHNDFHLGNIIVGIGRRITVIDFGSLAFGPPEFDFVRFYITHGTSRLFKVLLASYKSAVDYKTLRVLALQMLVVLIVFRQKRYGANSQRFKRTVADFRRILFER